MDSLLYAISRSVNRYDFHPAQRILYSYDILPIPRFFRRFIKIPEVVVQPESDDEVVSVLKIAEKHEIPIVPRGAATSVYGGTLPLKKSIVIDMTRMNSIDIKGDTAVVESGAVWWDVEKAAEKHGMALRIYPTSAPAATVGGWVAQNGYGVGSLKYGSVADNIVWLDVADFSGIRRVKGDELRYYVGLHGTTGIIVRACIKLRENREIECTSNFVDAERVGEIPDLVDGAYHSTYFSKKFLEPVLNGVIGEVGGNVLHVCSEVDERRECDEIARILWEGRFTLLKARKKGKIILSEVIIPKEKLKDLIMKLEELRVAYAAQPLRDFVLVFTLFIADDGYFTTMLRALKIIKMSERFDGVVYSTGMLFPHMSDRILSDCDEIKNFKREVDPHNLLNPGKVLQGNTISKAVRLAQMVL